MRNKKKVKKKICKHLFVVSGKYFGLVCCPYCQRYFTKRIPAYLEELREQDKWIEIKILSPNKKSAKIN